MTDEEEFFIDQLQKRIKEQVQEIDNCTEQLESTKKLLIMAQEENLKLQKIIDSFESGEMIVGGKINWKKNI